MRCRTSNQKGGRRKVWRKEWRKGKAGQREVEPGARKRGLKVDERLQSGSSEQTGHGSVSDV